MQLFRKEENSEP